MSGRSRARPQRAAVARARQKTAKPRLSDSEGWEIPCQPYLNSSINFVIAFVTSRDQLIQNKAANGENPSLWPGSHNGTSRRGRAWEAGPLALLPAAGNIA